jgi:predicted enzyme related to lactoylglutathione lyase
MATRDLSGIIWSELMSTDPDASGRFYEAVAGISVVEPGEGAGAYRMLVQNGRPIGGLTGPQSDNGMWPSGGPTGHWVGYFASDDVDAAVARAEQLGGSVLLGPVSIPETGVVAVLRDPDGATFGLFNPSSAPS